MLICGGSVSFFQTVTPASSLAISWILVKPGLGRAILPVSLLRLNQADARDELESLLQPRCLQGLPLSASTVTVRACLVIELRLTLCNPVDYSPLGSSVHGILQARMLEWVSMPSARGSPHPLPHTHPFLRKAKWPGFSFQ